MALVRKRGWVAADLRRLHPAIGVDEGGPNDNFSPFESMKSLYEQTLKEKRK
jgi:hypothetical protein